MSLDSCQFKCLNMSHCLLEDLSESVRYQAIGVSFYLMHTNHIQ